MHLKVKARALRNAPAPDIRELERHARDRDDWVTAGRKLGAPIGDFAALSALPGPAAWYDAPRPPKWRLP